MQCMLGWAGRKIKIFSKKFCVPTLKVANNLGGQPLWMKSFPGPSVCHGLYKEYSLKLNQDEFSFLCTRTSKFMINGII